MTRRERDEHTGVSLVAAWSRRAASATVSLTARSVIAPALGLARLLRAERQRRADALIRARSSESAHTTSSPGAGVSLHLSPSEGPALPHTEQPVPHSQSSRQVVLYCEFDGDRYARTAGEFPLSCGHPLALSHLVAHSLFGDDAEDAH